MNHSFKLLLCALPLALALTSCGDKNKPDPREPFIGEYTFTTSGSVDLYAGAAKILTVPMNEEGEMSIVMSSQPNALCVIMDEDSTLAYVSGDMLFMDPATKESSYGDLVLHQSLTFGRATLVGNTLSWTTDGEVTASYKSYSLLGTGQLDVVAVKKTTPAPAAAHVK